MSGSRAGASVQRWPDNASFMLKKKRSTLFTQEHCTTRDGQGEIRSGLEGAHVEILWEDKDIGIGVLTKVPTGIIVSSKIVKSGELRVRWIEEPRFVKPVVDILGDDDQSDDKKKKKKDADAGDGEDKKDEPDFEDGAIFVDMVEPYPGAPVTLTNGASFMNPAWDGASGGTKSTGKTFERRLQGGPKAGKGLFPNYDKSHVQLKKQWPVKRGSKLEEIEAARNELIVKPKIAKADKARAPPPPLCLSLYVCLT